jgi:hypothetical protein
MSDFLGFLIFAVIVSSIINLFIQSYFYLQNTPNYFKKYYTIIKRYFTETPIYENTDFKEFHQNVIFMNGDYIYRSCLFHNIDNLLNYINHNLPLDKIIIIDSILDNIYKIDDNLDIQSLHYKIIKPYQLCLTLNLTHTYRKILDMVNQNRKQKSFSPISIPSIRSRQSSSNV